MTEKTYKYEDEEFLVQEEEEGDYELIVSYGENSLTIRYSTEIYGTGYRVYYSSGWKGAWSTPDDAVNAACKELLSLAKAKTDAEFREELQKFFDNL